LVHRLRRFRMLRPYRMVRSAVRCPYAPFRTASVNAHPVSGSGRALPLRADPIPVFVGAGLRAERARSTHAQPCPYAPTAAFCAVAIR
ncbi:MAG TPA: hypothetical protein PKV95_01915, partial [Anaerolineaceae bacterium]|nr:hypothetical protein [Anaerolineaceae bacterium]